MKLYYTDISNNLTAFLAQTACDYARSGKRVFYIAPNSLSFEKERAVLERLENQASFDIMVTRFAQMARYLVLNQTKQQASLDDLGLSILFFRLLSQFDDSDLKVYGQLKTDIQFISQLVALYKDLQRSNLTVLDLEAMDTPDKYADLHLIFTAFEELLHKEDYENESKISQFRHLVEGGGLDEELAQLVVVVDGFTRFSAEEEALIAALDGRVAELVIAVYASQKAYKASYVEGNLYQAGVEFLRRLAQTYQTKPVYLPTDGHLDGLGKISKNIENHYDFSGDYLELTEEDTSQIEIWEVTNQKEEVEEVARAIRNRLHQGSRYKDILLLLGDVESYKLQIGKIFDKYEIPYYFGKAEEMSHHPLVHFVESLERLKRYNFRPEDLLNLVKSGLYGSFEQRELDRFEQYILFADIKGRAKFSRDFTVNSRAGYDLDELNQIRASLIQPLEELFKAQPQSVSSLLEKFARFLKAVALPVNMEKLASLSNEIDQEKQEQVWKAFCHILEQLKEIFGHEKLRLDDFLALLRAGMLASHYRTVPATVDVVNIRSYDLIEPHSAKYVYAIGLSQSNFPKISQPKSLLTEEEKAKVNAVSGQQGQFDLVSRDHIKKNHFAMISLLNSASEGLVLSSPQLYNEAEDGLSPYLKLLKEMGVPSEQKGRGTTLSASDIGHYKSLLSRVIEANRGDFDANWSKEEATFWSVALRYLRKKLDEEGIVIPTISNQVQTQPLANETLSLLYPIDKPLKLSASSLTDFYQNQYLYFIKHVLRLQEQDSLRPDARSHGNFLHRIFERLTKDHSPASFDDKLKLAIEQTRKEPGFAALYQEDADSHYSEQVLLDIARASSLVLREGSQIEVLANEAVFGQDTGNYLDLEGGRKLNITGKMDRLDRLTADGALGVVDYKSSSNQFHIDRFYNGLSPQLMTYLSAVQRLPEFSQSEKIFGAMYLHLLDPIVKLTDAKTSDQILAETYKNLVYKGLFLEEESNQLNQLYHKTKASLYSREELATMLTYHEKLYKDAAQTILSGSFAINPYTEDGRSVAGEQLKAITGFEANLHLGQARRLTKGGKKEDWLERMKKGGEA